MILLKKLEVEMENLAVLELTSSCTYIYLDLQTLVEHSLAVLESSAS